MTVVVKVSGKVLDDPVTTAAFVDDVDWLRVNGTRVVVVHGGGAQIDRMLARVGVPVTNAGGLRVTTPEVMDVVRMVLVGQVQRELVGALNRHVPVAVGLSGEDGDMVVAVRRRRLVDGTPYDLGLVGEVTDVATDLLTMLLDAGRVPVVSSVARERDGGVLNVNADSVAAALAVALGASRLVLLTDTEGLRTNWPANGSVIPRLSTTEVVDLLPRLTRGMAPKMEACLLAVNGGVPVAQLVDGRVEHALLAIVRGGESGTAVVPAGR